MALAFFEFTAWHCGKDIMARAKADADRDNRERWEREGRIAPTKKNDMEL